MTFYEMVLSEPSGGSWKITANRSLEGVLHVDVSWTGFEWHGYLSEITAISHNAFWGNLATFVREYLR